METILAKGHKAFFQKGEGRLVILLIGFEAEMASIFASFPHVSFLGIEPVNWDAELTPWPSERIFSKRDDFQGQADAFLSFLEQGILPLGEKEFGPKEWAIGGYSLAGLFAVYACTKSQRFSYLFSCSGSFWYPNFVECLSSSTLISPLRGAYFSLGDQEPKAKNKILASVGKKTEEVVSSFSKAGIPTQFVGNEGSHFADPGGRMRLALSHLLSL